MAVLLAHPDDEDQARGAAIPGVPAFLVGNAAALRRLARRLRSIGNDPRTLATADECDREADRLDSLED